MFNVAFDDIKTKQRDLIDELRKFHDYITKKSFSINLSEALDRNEIMKRSDLAKLASVSRSVITKYLKAVTAPSLTTVSNLASVLNVDITELTKLRIEAIDRINIKQKMNKLDKQVFTFSECQENSPDQEVRHLASSIKYLHDQIKAIESKLYNKKETIQKNQKKSDLSTKDTRKNDDAETCKNQAPEEGLNKASADDADDSEDILSNIEKAVEQSQNAGGYRLRSGDKETILRLVKAYLDI